MFKVDSKHSPNIYAIKNIWFCKKYLPLSGLSKVDPSLAAAILELEHFLDMHERLESLNTDYNRGPQSRYLFTAVRPGF